jgi:hypothetical protein
VVMAGHGRNHTAMPMRNEEAMCNNKQSGGQPAGCGEDKNYTLRNILDMQ